MSSALCYTRNFQTNIKSHKLGTGRLLWNCQLDIGSITATLHEVYVTMKCKINLLCNNTANVRVMKNWGAFWKPLLLWESNEYYTTWLCVFVALDNQHAMRMHHIVISGLPVFMIFFHIFSQTARFSKNNLVNTKSVFWFSLQIFFSETFLSLRRNERDMIKNVRYIVFHVKYTLFLSDFNETLILQFF